MRQAEEALKRITDFLVRLDTLPASAGASADIAGKLEEAAEAFAGHIADDLNTAAALGIMFDLVRALNSAIDAGELSAADAPAVRATFERFDRVFGVLSLRRTEDERPPVPVDEIEQLIAARKAARLARNFAEADRIRNDLDVRGILLEDTGSVTRWKRK
jgi:cysteinyl-tRNA synthetase